MPGSRLRGADHRQPCAQLFDPGELDDLEALMLN
jgi:hypothetical protein